MTRDPEVQTWHRTLLVGSVGLISLTAWLALWQFGVTLHSTVHHHHAQSDSTIALLFVGAWTVMTVAMMLPTSVPLIATFDTIAGQRQDRLLLVALVIVGYLATWALVGLVVYGAGAIVQRVVLASAWLQAHASIGGAGLLLVAGAYQFTPLKHRCLAKCRSPLSFVLGHWQGQHDRRNALWLGAHHGLFCVGCCWALMLVMFAVGVGNLGWMLLLGAVMAVEKNVSWGRRLSAPLGILLVMGGLTVIALT
jgi:predicted metal-binding membrane protein